MADAEFSLTENGVDVTDHIWDWASVTLTDSWSAHLTLAYTKREPFGDATAPAAFTDVRLVNLLTSKILFEGIVAAGPLAQRIVDPTWVDTDVSCIGYGSLLDTSVLQVGFDSSLPQYGSGDSKSILQAILDDSLADHRIDLAVTEYTPPLYDPAFSLFHVGETYLWAQFTNTMQAISTLLAESRWSSDEDLDFRVKVVPGYGCILSMPSIAFRGPVLHLDQSARPALYLTADSYGRPTAVSWTTDTGAVASAVVASYEGTGTHVVVDTDRATATNGYLVLRDAYEMVGYLQPDADIWTRYEADHDSVTYWDLTTPQLPEDILVGHSVKFDDPHHGIVTATVQAIRTSFANGVVDATAGDWPQFLDGSHNLDGTWDLDDTTSRVIPRRMRTTQMTLSGMAHGHHRGRCGHRGHDQRAARAAGRAPHAERRRGGRDDGRQYDGDDGRDVVRRDRHRRHVHARVRGAGVPHHLHPGQHLRLGGRGHDDEPADHERRRRDHRGPVPARQEQGRRGQ
jgi:hypothetical protein